MNDLTEVELLWLEKRIENRIRFGRASRKGSSIVVDGCYHLRQAVSLRSFDGRRATSERQSRGSTFCGRSRPDSAVRPCRT